MNLQSCKLIILFFLLIYEYKVKIMNENKNGFLLKDESHRHTSHTRLPWFNGINFTCHPARRGFKPGSGRLRFFTDREWLLSLSKEMGVCVMSERFQSYP